jgi:hypothetical protein
MQSSKRVLKKQSADQTTYFYGPNSFPGLPVWGWTETREFCQASQTELACECASSGFIGTLAPAHSFQLYLTTVENGGSGKLLRFSTHWFHEFSFLYLACMYLERIIMTVFIKFHHFMEEHMDWLLVISDEIDQRVFVFQYVCIIHSFKASISW